MKKYGWKVGLLTIFAVLVLFWLIRAPILSAYVSSKIGLPVTIRWVGLWPSRTNMHGFVMMNPSGFKNSAFKAKEVVCRYRLNELFGESTVIDLIEVDHSVLTIEFKDPNSTDNNWTVLGEKVEKRQEGSKVLIKKLVLKDFNVDIQGTNNIAKAKQTHFDEVEFDNIGSEEGFPTERLIRMIFETGGIDQFLKGLFNPEKGLQKAMSPLKMFGI